MYTQGIFVSHVHHAAPRPTDENQTSRPSTLIPPYHHHHCSHPPPPHASQPAPCTYARSRQGLHASGCRGDARGTERREWSHLCAWAWLSATRSRYRGFAQRPADTSRPAQPAADSQKRPPSSARRQLMATSEHTRTPACHLQGYSGYSLGGEGVKIVSRQILGRSWGPTGV